MGDCRVLWPDCGWIGPTAKIDDGDGGGDPSCPICATAIEIVD